MKKELTQQAVDRQKEKAQTDDQELLAQVEFLTTLESDKESQVKNLDTSLIEYQRQVDDLKTQQDVLDKLRQQATFKTLKPATPMTPASSRWSTPWHRTPPTLVWPKSYVFIPLGTAAGLGLSFLLSYLLVP